jgi:hypothetical protein
MKQDRQKTGTTIAKKQTTKGPNASALTPKSEKPVSAKRASGLSFKIEATGSPEANQDTRSSSVSKREMIALLAYSFWEQRGGQSGSAEEDWFRAERVIALEQSL